jgi:biotin carboxyl carrier protein
MQNEIRSSKGGTVDRVAVAPGEAVETGALLVAIGAET